MITNDTPTTTQDLVDRVARAYEMARVGSHASEAHRVAHEFLSMLDAVQGMAGMAGGGVARNDPLDPREANFRETARDPNDPAPAYRPNQVRGSQSGRNDGYPVDGGQQQPDDGRRDVRRRDEPGSLAGVQPPMPSSVPSAIPSTGDTDRAGRPINRGPLDSGTRVTPDGQVLSDGTIMGASGEQALTGSAGQVLSGSVVRGSQPRAENDGYPVDGGTVTSPTGQQQTEDGRRRDAQRRDAQRRDAARPASPENSPTVSRGGSVSDNNQDHNC